MISQKSIQTKTHTSFNNLPIILLVVLLTSITGISIAAVDQRPSLWKYNNKNCEKTRDKQSLRDTLAKLQDAIKSLHSQLTPLLDKCEFFNETNPEVQKTLKVIGDELAAGQKRIDKLEKEIAEFEAALESKSKGGPDGNQSFEELRNKLKEAKDKCDELKNNIKTGTLDFVRLKGKAVFVMIYENHVAPIDEPYYSCRYGYAEDHGKRIFAVEKKRVRDGEPISQAVRAGGCLDKLLSNLDTEKEYVSFQVCKDSIGAFQLAVEEIRRRNHELKRKISYSWEPEEDRTFVFSSSVDSDGPWGENPK